MASLRTAAVRAARQSTSLSRHITASRAYAAVAEAQSSFLGGPPPPKVADEVVLKRYVGKGFPKIPGLRHLVHPHHGHLHTGDPVRDLTLPLRRKGGRNHTGRIVNRWVGGGHKRRLRIVDFHRVDEGEHDVVRIEYDPGRSAHIALIKKREGGASSVPKSEGAIEEGAKLAELESEDGSAKGRHEVRGGWSYILAPEGVRAGSIVRSFRAGIPSGFVEGWNDDPSSPQSVHDPTSTSSRALGILRTQTLKPGNVLPLNLLPAGTICHAISLTPTGRMQLCRAAGSFAQIVAHHGPSGEALGGGEILSMTSSMGIDGVKRKAGTVLVKLQSGEVRRLQPECVAVVGSVSNKEHHSRQLGKAGRSRWLGQKPRVRGVAMNACDHPHGGGRGKSKGNKDPRSVWGWLTKGKRTRRSKDKDGNKQVVSERPRGKAKN